MESLTFESLLILSVDYPSDDPPITVVTEWDDLHMVIRVIEVIFLKLFVNSFFDTGDSVVVPRLCVEAVEFPGLLRDPPEEDLLIGVSQLGFDVGDNFGGGVVLFEILLILVFDESAVFVLFTRDDISVPGRAMVDIDELGDPVLELFAKFSG